jgi:hypothetical protein
MEVERGACRREAWKRLAARLEDTQAIDNNENFSSCIVPVPKVCDLATTAYAYEPRQHQSRLSIVKTEVH